MDTEEKVIATIKKVMPAVISIMISKTLEDLEKEMPHEIYSFLPGHDKAGKRRKKIKIPDFLIENDGMVSVGGGSGFLVDPNGLILTNKHVISDTKAKYTIILNDERKFPAEIISRDPINDVAILKIEASDLPYVELGESSGLELGQSVIAIGNALGMFKNTVSVGIVSGLSRSISAKEDPKGPSEELRGLIQTDAAINPGNSGGPLVNLAGAAIGVNAAIVAGAENISFAIPINTAKRDLDDLKKFGRIRRPLLGVRYIIADDKLQKKMNLPTNYGALVLKEGLSDSAVIPGSPAAVAGLKENDLILECNGQKVDTEHPIQDYLNNCEVGQTMQLLVYRNGKEFKTKLTLAERK